MQPSYRAHFVHVGTAYAMLEDPVYAMIVHPLHPSKFYQAGPNILADGIACHVKIAVILTC